MTTALPRLFAFLPLTLASAPALAGPSAQSQLTVSAKVVQSARIARNPAGEVAFQVSRDAPAPRQVLRTIRCPRASAGRPSTCQYRELVF